MGVAHFVMSVVYPWEHHVAGLYAPVRWALFATTVFFGILLVWGGLLTILVTRTGTVPSRLRTAKLGGMAAFWLLALAYELVVPFPATGARWCLPVFSLFVLLLLYGVGLLAGIRRHGTEGESGRRLPRPRISGTQPA